MILFVPQDVGIAGTCGPDRDPVWPTIIDHIQGFQASLGRDKNGIRDTINVFIIIGTAPD